MLHARGIDCEIFEQSDRIHELGVGINTLPTIRCRAGRSAAPHCSATPRIRCTRSAQTAPRRRSSKAIVRGYAATAGFAREQVNAPPRGAAGAR